MVSIHDATTVAPRRVELAFAAAARKVFDRLLYKPIDRPKLEAAIADIVACVRRQHGNEWTLKDTTKGPPANCCLWEVTFDPAPADLVDGQEIMITLEWAQLSPQPGERTVAALSTVSTATRNVVRWLFGSA